MLLVKFKRISKSVLMAHIGAEVLLKGVGFGQREIRWPSEPQPLDDNLQTFSTQNGSNLKGGPATPTDNFYVKTFSTLKHARDQRFHQQKAVPFHIKPLSTLNYRNAPS